MGYRSEVSLVLTRKLFAKMLQEIPEETKQMVGYAERFESKEDSILLYWDYIKWYEDTYPINKFQRFLEAVEETDRNDTESTNSLRFHLLRLGEDWDDNVELGRYWDNPFSAHFSRSIEIDSSGEDLKLDAFL